MSEPSSGHVVGAGEPTFVDLRNLGPQKPRRDIDVVVEGQRSLPDVKVDRPGGKITTAGKNTVWNKWLNFVKGPRG